MTKKLKTSFARKSAPKKPGNNTPLPRNRQTEREIAQIFEHGTERELMQYLRENGLTDGSPRFVEIVKLFHEHGGKRR